MPSAFFFADTSQTWLYHGGFWLVASGSVLLILGALDHGPLAAGLSWKPLAALGLISYGVYLYHWPIFIFLTSERTGLDGVALAVLKVGITLALAVASYFLIEQPVRQRRWRLTLGPSVVIVAAIMLALFLATSVLHQAAATRDVVASPDLELSATDLAVAAPTAAPVVDRPPRRPPSRAAAAACALPRRLAGPSVVRHAGGPHERRRREDRGHRRRGPAPALGR